MTNSNANDMGRPVTFLMSVYIIDSHNLHYGISEVEFASRSCCQKPAWLVTELEGFHVWP